MSRKTIAIAAGVLLTAGAVAAVAQGHRGWRGGDGDMMMPGMGRGMGDGMGMGMEHQDGMGRGGFMQRWRGMSATDHDTRTRERFARFDRNSDGVIDAAEVEAALAERMSERHGRLGRKGGAMGERMLRRFDENRDGKVTRDEFNNVVRKRFAEVDLNSDGRITDDDLPPTMRGRNVLADGGGLDHGRGFGSGMAGRVMGFMRGADANKDGVITLEEAQAQAGKMFAQLDRTKDNVIDTADSDAMRKEMTDYRVKRFIHSFGGDKDGKVTREQFEKVAKERFAQMDFNNDGRVTRDEMPGRGHWGGHGRGGDESGPGGSHGRRMMGPGGPGMGGPGMGAPGAGGTGSGPGPAGPGRN